MLVIFLRSFSQEINLVLLNNDPNQEWDYWDYRKSTRDERMFYEIQTRAIRQAFELIKRTYLSLKG